MIQGRHAAGFASLARLFGRVLEENSGGAALCVYLDGRPVVDLWGGYRDSLGTPWERDTTCVSFSTTKGVTATALHMLVDRGEVDYAAPVARYWPEFAQHGKGGIRVADVLSHRAGLFDVRALLEHADTLLDWDATCAALAEARVSPVSGTRHAYHALTFGHLVGEIVRRVSGVPFSRFVREEIAEPLGLDGFWVGAPPLAIQRAARLLTGKVRSQEDSTGARQRGRRRGARRARALQRALRLAGLPADFRRVKAAFAPRGIGSWDFSEPRVLAACLPSAGGLFTARDLARMYACLALGGELDGVRLLSRDTLREATRVHAPGPDAVLMVPMGWRLGYHGVATSVGVPRSAFGHFGYGGSGAWAHPGRRMSFAFVVNSGGGVPIPAWRIFRLGGAALTCVRSLQLG